MSNYIIYTTDNGVLNFTNDLRVFIGGNDISINNWNKIYTNVKEYYGTTVIGGSTTLPANEKINIADILIDGIYLTTNITILTTLSFTTSNYIDIRSEDDTITFTIEFIRPDRQDSYTFTYPLHKLYLQTIQFVKTFNEKTANLNKISIYLTSTFPLKLRRPSKGYTYIYIVGI